MICALPARRVACSTPRNGHKIVVMKNRKRPAAKLKPRRPRATAGTASSIAAAGFKARCLELMDQVRETGVEFVVTKHGTPVAKLVPYAATKRQPLFGSMKGTVLKFERPLDPIDGDWDVNRD